MTPAVRWLAGWVLAAVVISTCVLLGRWQLDRAQQKQGLLEQAAGVLADRQARPLAAAADPHRSRELDWAAGEGHFVDAPALLLDNQRRGGQVGVRAYRLFDAGEGPWLMVELGWLPLPPDRSLPRVDAPDGTYRVEGLLSAPPSPGLALGEPFARRQDALLMPRMDIPALEQALGQAIAPRVLRLDPRLELGYSRDLELLPNTLTPEKHRGYALQWFGLAATAAIIAVLLTVRALRPSRRSRR